MLQDLFIACIIDCFSHSKVNREDPDMTAPSKIIWTGAKLFAKVYVVNLYRTIPFIDGLSVSLKNQIKHI